MTMTVEEALGVADECLDEVQSRRSTEQIALVSLAAELRRLRAENAMLTEQRDEHARNSANATTQCITYQQEIAELLEQMAQERKRLDWALTVGAWYWPIAKVLTWHPDILREIRVLSNNPRATIDELIAAEAAGGGK